MKAVKKMYSITEEIKNRVNILDVAKSFGIQINRQGKALCVFHEEKTPSLTFFENTNSFYCYGCGVGGSVIDFVKHYKNLTTAGAIQWLVEYAGLPRTTDTAQDKPVKRQVVRQVVTPQNSILTEKHLQIYSDFLELLTLTGFSENYLKVDRCLASEIIELAKIKGINSKQQAQEISAELLKRHDRSELEASGLFTKKGFLFFLPCIIFPHFEGGRAVYFTSRNFAAVKSFKLAAPQKFYIGAGCETENKIYVFEGVLDALSYAQIFGKSNYIATHGLPNKNKIAKIKSIFPQKKLIAVFDYDKAGNAAQKDTSETSLNWLGTLQKLNIKPSQINENFSDFNDLLCLLTDRQEEFEERAAIMEYDGGLDRQTAERMARRLI